MKPLRLVLVLLFGLILAATVYVFWTQRGAITDALSRVDWTVLVPPLLAGLFGIGLRFVRFRAIIAGFGHDLVPWPGLRYYVAGFAFGLTPGRAGEVMRGGWLQRLGIPLNISVLATGLERIFDLVALGLFALIGVIALGSTVVDMRWILMGLAALIVLMGGFLAFGWLNISPTSEEHHDASTQPPTPVQKAAFFARKQFEALSAFRIGPINLCVQMVLSLSMWAIGGAVMWWFAWQLGYVDVPFANIVGIYALSIFVGTLSMLPGGVGGTEVSMAALLGTQDIPIADAVVIVMLVRVLLFWTPLVLGALLIPRRLPKQTRGVSE